MEDRDYKLQEILETYRRDGSLIREKSRVLVETWLDQIYPRLIDPDMPTSGLLDIGKVLIELGDLKPKNSVAQQTSGPGFSITINVPSHTGAPITVIDGTATVAEENNKPPELEDLDELSAMPEHIGIKVPDFDLNDDLMGPQLEEDDE